MKVPALCYSLVTITKKEGADCVFVWSEDFIACAQREKAFFRAVCWLGFKVFIPSHQDK